MNWQYKHEEQEFPQIPEGTYRCRIESAEMAISSKGNDMLVLKLEVSGQKSSIWNYITFLNDRPEITNRLLTQMFDSFAIPEGDFNIATYAGKAGACVIKHDAEGKARVSYFLAKSKQINLPAWQDTGKTKKPELKTDENGFVEAGDSDDDIPF